MVYRYFLTLQAYLQYQSSGMGGSTENKLLQSKQSMAVGKI